MFSGVFSLGLFLLVAGPDTRPASRPAAAGDAIRVMTFNIRYGTANDGEDRWERRRDMVFDVIRRHKPDVVGVQEALRFQLDEIAKALPVYAEIGTGRDDGRQAGEYSAILYRTNRVRLLEHGTFWFSDTPETPGSRHWGNRLPRICTWGRFEDNRTRRTFHHYNVHLDHQSQPSRERSAELLADHIRRRAHPDPVIVTGDFNAGEDNPAIRYLQGKLPRASAPGPEAPPSPRLRDTFRVLHPDAKDTGTFNGFRGTRTGEKIDYVFVSPGVAVLDAQIVHDQHDGRYPSDHFPVTATIRLPGDR